MLIAFRIVILLCCAYAGWETASIQHGDYESLSRNHALQSDRDDE